MRDDSTAPPAFLLPASDDDPQFRRVRGHEGLVRPPEPIRTWRILAAGSLGAGVLGVVVAFSAARAPPGPTPPAATLAPASGAAELTYTPISGPYAPPDRQRVVAAYRDVARIAGQDGIGGVARAGMTCFQSLARKPDYGLMDYCLALDAFGAQAYLRQAGETAPTSTWFGQGPVRRQRAVQLLTAGETDANSRLLDTNRLVQEVAIQPPEPALASIAQSGLAPSLSATDKPAGPLAMAVEAPVRVTQSGPSSSSSPSSPGLSTRPPSQVGRPTVTGDTALLPRPTPSAPQSRNAPAILVQRQAAAAPLARAPNASPPADTPAAASKPNVLVERVTQPPATRVQTAPPSVTDLARRQEPPAADRCSGFQSRGARMVCEEPALAAADRRLSAALNRALDVTDNPSSLIAEQNRWLALRDRLAPDYGAVMDLYQDRIAELRQHRY